MSLRLRRGTTAQRTVLRFAVGEPIWDTTEDKLYIGDGPSGTLGGVAVDTTATSLTFNDTANDSDTLGVDFTNTNGVITGTVNASSVIGAPSMSSGGGGFTLLSEVTLSGTATTIATGIPAGTTMVVVNFEGVGYSTASNSTMRLVIGGSSLQSGSGQGYLSNSATIGASGSTFYSVDFQGGFALCSGIPAGDDLYGSMILTLKDSATNAWATNHSLGSNGGITFTGGGTKSITNGALATIGMESGTAFGTGGTMSVSYI